MSGKSEVKPVSVEAAFLLTDILPDAASAYSFKMHAIEDAVNDGNIILDANVLLLPYGADTESISEAGKVYKKFVDEGRLHIPAQAMREYLRLRPSKIGEIIQGVFDTISKYPNPKKINYPVLEKVGAVAKLNDIINEYDNLRKKINHQRDAVISEISAWGLSDPVLEEYRRTIPSAAVREIKLDRKVLLEETSKRFSQSIPPGYKDASKEDGGIGDYLIWKTILEIGSETKKSSIFVSGETKADWQHRSNNLGFLPRFELLDEYRRASDGGSFFIIPLSKLLELRKAEPNLVVEIRKEEERINEESQVYVECPYCRMISSAHLGLPLGSSSTPKCPACENSFHAHRTSDGVVVNARGGREIQVLPSDADTIVCPRCGTPSPVDLGSDTGATRWSQCRGCNTILSAHRVSEGAIFVNVHG